MPSGGFKQEHTFDKRKAEADKILEKYPDRIPVICEKHERSHDIPDIDKKKYLVPSDLTVGQFAYVIRRRIRIAPEKSIFIYVDKDNSQTMTNTALQMSSIYEEKKDKDGFLYITYAGENIFGGMEGTVFKL